MHHNGDYEPIILLKSVLLSSYTPEKGKIIAVYIHTCINLKRERREKLMPVR